MQANVRAITNEKKKNIFEYIFVIIIFQHLLLTNNTTLSNVNVNVNER